MRTIKKMFGISLLSCLFHTSWASGHFQFMIDEDRVYCVLYSQEKHFKIADAKTFTLVGSFDSKYGRTDRFAKDRYHVYDGCRKIAGIFPKEFDILEGWDFVKANHQVYYTNGDHGKWILLTGLIPEQTTFEAVVLTNAAYSSAQIIKDHQYVFYQHAPNRDPLIVPKADPATFEVLNQYYAKDQNHLYYLSQESFEEHFLPLPQADVMSFQLSDESHHQHIATDKNWRYRYIMTTHKIEITPLDAPIN